MKITLILLFIVYILKAIYVFKLRQKRDEIDFTTKQGAWEVIRINNLIDFLNGAWLWKTLTYRKKK